MGKYIKKFDTHSDYEDFIETEDFIRPNVSYCVDNKDVHYNSTQTLFALEIESGKFISFYFLSGTLYGNTDDGSSAIWVLDGNGVVVDNISYPIGERTPILAQINEHYGTTFTGWSDNEMGLRFGDTVPNWNAYEKIRDTNVSFKISATATHNSLGHIKDETLQIFTWAERPGWGWTSNDNGVISDYGGPSQNSSSAIISRLLELGITIKEVSKLDVNFSIGEEIQDWDKYLHL